MPRFRSNCDDNWINIGLSEMTDEEFEDWMESDAHKKEILEHEIYRRLQQKYAGHLTEKMVSDAISQVVRDVYYELHPMLRVLVTNAVVDEFYKVMTPETIAANLEQSFKNEMAKMVITMIDEASVSLRGRFEYLESRMNTLFENQDALMAYIKDLALKVESKG